MVNSGIIRKNGEIWIPIPKVLGIDFHPYYWVQGPGGAADLSCDPAECCIINANCHELIGKIHDRDHDKAQLALAMVMCDMLNICEMRYVVPDDDKAGENGLYYLVLS